MNIRNKERAWALILVIIFFNIGKEIIQNIKKIYIKHCVENIIIESIIYTLKKIMSFI